MGLEKNAFINSLYGGTLAKEREEESARKAEYINGALQRAAMLYKENPEKGVVYLWVTGVDPDGNEEQNIEKVTIAEFTDGHVVTASGKKFDLAGIDGVALAADMDAEEIAEMEKKL